MVVVVMMTMLLPGCTGRLPSALPSRRLPCCRCGAAREHRLRHVGQLPLQIFDGPLVAETERLEVRGQVHHLHAALFVGPAVVHRRATRWLSVVVPAVPMVTRDLGGTHAVLQSAQVNRSMLH